VSDGSVQGLIFDVDTFAVHDGPGIRMAVYLKGCPLQCKWCHSPESILPRPEVIFLGDRCVLCGRCTTACRSNGHSLDDGRHTFQREHCSVCGRCVEACPSGALALKGRLVTADEIISRAVRMKPFFLHSGGGVTLTGGEVTMQPDFALAVLEGCRAHGIHAAVETCGACSWDTLKRIVSATDLVLYDLKLIDDAAHRQWTGAPNQRILDNARRLAGASAEVVFRVPLIPGLTDTDAAVSSILDFLADAGLRRVTFLPFNPSTSAKYEWLGLACEVSGEPQTAPRLAEILSSARRRGLDATLA
jgi:pyruvate formate lyase activating enzyme